MIVYSYDQAINTGFTCWIIEGNYPPQCIFETTIKTRSVNTKSTNYKQWFFHNYRKNIINNHYKVYFKTKVNPEVVLVEDTHTTFRNATRSLYGLRGIIFSIYPLATKVDVLRHPKKEKAIAYLKENGIDILKDNEVRDTSLGKTSLKKGYDIVDSKSQFMYWYNNNYQDYLKTKNK